MFTSYSSNLFQRGPAKTNVGSAHGFVGSATLVEAGVVKTTAPLPWARTSVIEVERISLNTMKPASGNEAAEWAVPARVSAATAAVTSGMGRMGTRFGSGARRLEPRFRRVPDSLRHDVSRRRLPAPVARERRGRCPGGGARGRRAGGRGRRTSRPRGDRGRRPRPGASDRGRAANLPSRRGDRRHPPRRGSELAGEGRGRGGEGALRHP